MDENRRTFRGGARHCTNRHAESELRKTPSRFVASSHSYVVRNFAKPVTRFVSLPAMKPLLLTLGSAREHLDFENEQVYSTGVGKSTLCP